MAARWSLAADAKALHGENARAAVRVDGTVTQALGFVAKEDGPATGTGADGS